MKPRLKDLINLLHRPVETANSKWSVNFRHVNYGFWHTVIIEDCKLSAEKLSLAENNFHWLKAA
ncbi:hypothetical protein MTYP_01930 [Methylophilaceae bacterium]|nr:hypothetical protein MTYP_01930 [Methylophilaceae bacterium]